MNRIEQIAQDNLVRTVLDCLSSQADQVVETAVAIQQIAAPTFAEEKRAAFIAARFETIGLSDVTKDELHNVYGRYPAATPGSRPPVILSAHSDTVFPADTDLTIRRNGRNIYGPGLGDNAVGLAGLLHVAQVLIEHDLQIPTDVWFVANVGEEGLGDLRGMRAMVERFGKETVYIIVEGGLYGQISHQAIGVRRFRVEVKTPGGHSWGNFGQTSAIHELARLITEIDNLDVPKSPKTTLNVGVIEGGTSVNTIAQSASMLLDLRSENALALEDLVKAVTEIIDDARNRLSKDGRSDVTITLEQIGSRPAGGIPRQTPLIAWAEDALRFVGCHQITHVVSSTDANIPLSRGITAVCFGLTESGNAHRLNEYIDPTHLPDGLNHLLLLLLAAAGL